MKYLYFFFAAAIVATVAIANMSIAGEGMIKVGDRAPEFTSTDDQGKTWKSVDYVGKKVVVVYFYPADFTGGCTKQACGFRDDFQALADKDAMVIGVSGDTAKTHALFKKYHKLPFTLLADSAALSRHYGPGQFCLWQRATKSGRGSPDRREHSQDSSQIVHSQSFHFSKRRINENSNPLTVDLCDCPFKCAVRPR